MLRAFNFLFELFEWTFFFLGREGENCVLAYSFTSRDNHWMHVFLSIHFSTSDAKFKTHNTTFCLSRYSFSFKALRHFSDISPWVVFRYWTASKVYFNSKVFSFIKSLQFCICVQTYFMKSSFCCSAKPKSYISFTYLNNIAGIMEASTI